MTKLQVIVKPEESVHTMMLKRMSEKINESKEGRSFATDERENDKVKQENLLRGYGSLSRWL